jgi:hypothetical protein
VKRSDLINALLGRLREVTAREGVGCEALGAEVAGPAEYVVTAYGTPADVARLAEALRRDAELRDVHVVEDVAQTNRRLYGAADAGRRRHLHIALSAPSLW